MAFNDNNVLKRDENEKNDLRAQRKAQMFGDASVAKKSAEYPLNEIVYLPHDIIDHHPDNSSIFDMTHIEELSVAIDEDGFRGAIEVFKKEDGRYEISAGHRRYEAMMHLGKKEIPVIIMETPDEIKRAKLLLRSNINNRDNTPLFKGLQIQYYIDHVLKPSNFKGNERQECARFFNISESSVHKLLCLTRLTPKLKELANNPQFPYTAFRKAVTLSEEQQNRLYEEIQKYIETYPESDISRTRIEQMISTINASDSLRNVTKQKAEKSFSKVEESGNLVYPTQVGVPIPSAANQLPRVEASYNPPEEDMIGEDGDIIPPPVPGKVISDVSYTAPVKHKPLLDTLIESIMDQTESLDDLEMFDVYDKEKITAHLDALIQKFSTIKNCL